ncbi:MAG: hypothetical protein ABI876_04640, partial [Bacteroidota bacterium]
MVHELAPAADAEFTREQVLAWFRTRYPKIKENTVSAHLIMISTNLPSRLHYGPRRGGEDDLLFQLNRGRYRRYNSETDAPPIHFRNVMDTSDLRTQLLPIIESIFPAWTGFDDPRFVKEEITYKQRAVTAAAEMLNRAAMESLIEQGEYDELIGRLKAVAKSGGNLLWQNIPGSGDLRILSAPQLDRVTFFPALLDLLHGEGESHERFARYLDYVTGAGLPSIWAFPTYFLFVCHPESELLIKPTWVKQFLDLIHRRAILTDVPSAASYEAMLQLVGEIRAAFDDFDPADMVDIQSLMWVCATGTGQAAVEGTGIDAKRTEIRSAAEKRARIILQQHLGALDESTLREFFREVNTDWSNGRICYNRFGTAFGGSLVAMMIKDIDALNIWTERIWNAAEDTLDDILDEFWKPGAGPV